MAIDKHLKAGKPEGMRKKLAEQLEKKLFRELLIFGKGADFCSNDYLGMARQVVDDMEGGHGSTGSRLISGNSFRLERFEKKWAAFFGQESALLYNSGYDANLGFFSCVPQRGDTVIYDRLCHASVRDGIRLGNARSFSFHHNDATHLEERLKQVESGDVFVAVEGVYSMDGDLAPLAQIALICEKYGAYLVVDEAHSGGLYGEHGNGLVAELGLDDYVFAKIMTFGKAYGSHGAIICGSTDLRSYLINFSRPLIYTTALPPYAQERIDLAIDTVKHLNKERAALQANIEFFSALVHAHQLNCTPTETPIQAVVIPGNENALKKAEVLRDAGFHVKAILSPTVPEGEERIRICLHSYNTQAEIEKLVNLLQS